jgi:hypothetical protein
VAITNTMKNYDEKLRVDERVPSTIESSTRQIFDS